MFSQKLTDELVSSYLIEPEPNRFGPINTFTNAAQKLGPLQRIDMERFAGTLLEAPLWFFFSVVRQAKNACLFSFRSRPGFNLISKIGRNWRLRLLIGGAVKAVVLFCSSNKVHNDLSICLIEGKTDRIKNVL